ncbi:MAG: MerR family transcriptional regulator [Candidatus Omnitrophota bacterium]|jgi:DNA-binding transcriptional MerR regulator
MDKGPNNNRMTITEAAEAVGVVPRTIMRWEKSGKINQVKRDWRGWRVFTEDDLQELRKFHDSIY